MQEVSEEREGVSQELSGTFYGSHRYHDRDLCSSGITPNRVGIKKNLQGKFRTLFGGICERC